MKNFIVIVALVFSISVNAHSQSLKDFHGPQQSNVFEMNRIAADEPSVNFVGMGDDFLRDTYNARHIWYLGGAVFAIWYGVNVLQGFKAQNKLDECNTKQCQGDDVFEWSDTANNSSSSTLLGVAVISTTIGLLLSYLAEPSKSTATSKTTSPGAPIHVSF
jgi:hypothetical protein